MTEELVFEWLVREVWDRRQGALLKKIGMLVLDASNGHLIETVKTSTSSLNTDLIMIVNPFKHMNWTEDLWEENSYSRDKNVGVR